MSSDSCETTSPDFARKCVIARLGGLRVELPAAG